MHRLRIVIVSASPVVRARVSRAIADDPRFNLLGLAGDLSQAFMLSESQEPDIALISDSLTKVREFEGMRSLFYALGMRYLRIVDRAPDDDGTRQVPLKGGLSSEPVIHPQMSADDIWNASQLGLQILRNDHFRRVAATEIGGQGRRQKIVVIGASTGGIDGLLTLLSTFPADCPPTAIVQHTGRGFGESLVRLLARRCSAEVVAARDGLPMLPGRVCLAAGTGAHLTIQKGEPNLCRLQPGPAESGHVPSVNTLFRSVLALAPNVVGAILTGMGQDGAEGLLELRRAGCSTFGQDEATSTVYGMPKVAWSIGAVQTQLPIDQIAGAILKACEPVSPVRSVIS